MNRKVGILGALGIVVMIVIGTQAVSQEIQRQIQLRSAPVTVTNTPLPVVVTNPVDPGRIAYQSFVAAPNCNTDSCTFVFPPVPAQRRLVIQSVSGILGVTATPNAVTAILRDNTNLTNGLSTFLPPFSATGVLFVQPVLYYVEAQGQPEVDVQAMGNGATFHQSPFMTLSGYLLDCAASPCAPLAQ